MEFNSGFKGLTNMTNRNDYPYWQKTRTYNQTSEADKFHMTKIH